MADVPGTPPPPPPPMPGGPAGSFTPKGLGDILSAAFELYARHWQRLFVIVAVVAIPFSIVQYGLSDAASSGDSGGARAFGGLILLFFSLFITFLVLGAVGRAAAGTLIGRELSTDEAYRYGLRRWAPILWVSILVGLAVAGGFILLIVPGIIFWTKLSMAVPALVVEDKRGTAAMSRSWNLTTGQFWHVLVTLLVAGILAGIVNGVIGAIGGSSWFLRGVFAGIATTVTTPFVALVYGLLYVDLRARKEGFGPGGLEADLARTAI
jgi:hypothetical protein